MPKTFKLFNVNGIFPSINTSHDKFLGRSWKHHCLGLRENHIYILDDIRSNKRCVSILEWNEDVLIKIPKLDLGKLSFRICNKHSLHPAI